MLKLHFKVLLCYDQENILLQICICIDVNFFSFFFFFVFWVHLFSISEGLQFLVIVLRSYSKVVCVKVFLFVHTLCIQCAFLYGD